MIKLLINAQQKNNSMGERLLITGGTGFLGKRLALRLKGQYEILLTGRNNKQNLAAKEFTGCDVAPMDISNIESVRDIFAEFKPDVVIHGAATKFVDIAEQYPMECIDVNVLGSQNIARVSIMQGVETVIGVSTDKASPPVRNIYGLSKSLMEKMYCSLDPKSKTKFACVRYGNVAWSTGSVFTIWKKMHEETKTIGTTGPEMRRFFFTVDDAVNLVVAGLERIDTIRGKILSRRMKAAKMEEILKAWVKHRGGKYERIEGRPGERLDEFLIGDLELPFTEEIDINGITHYLISFNKKVDKPISLGLSSANTDRLTEQEILEIIDNPPVEEI